MLASESAHLDLPPDLVAHSQLPDPLDALSEALNGILSGLIERGCGPHHLLQMRWLTQIPHGFHLSRHEAELAYREVFGGFRPAIRLCMSAEPGLTVRAWIERPQAGGLEDCVDGYRLPDLARQYSPRLQTDMRALFAQWWRDGRAFRARHCGLDLAYGPGRFEQLDLYRPKGAGQKPVWVFLHGGYWQAADKIQHAQFAQGALDAGYAVAMPNYGLAPETPLETSCAQMVAALNFLVRHADALALDGSRLHVSGHSAGAHLAAMALLSPECPPVLSALFLSGLFRLEPLGSLPLGRLLGLQDTARAKRLSPFCYPRPAVEKLAFAVGEKESDAFKAQSTQQAQAWRGPAPWLCPGHHFSLLEGLKNGALLDLALTLAASA